MLQCCVSMLWLYLSTSRHGMFAAARNGSFGIQSWHTVWAIQRPVWRTAMADSGRTFLSRAVQTQQPHPPVSTCCASTGTVCHPTWIDLLNPTAYVDVAEMGIRAATCSYWLAILCTGWNICSQATHHSPFCPQRRSSCTSGKTECMLIHTLPLRQACPVMAFMLSIIQTSCLTVACVLTQNASWTAVGTSVKFVNVVSNLLTFTSAVMTAAISEARRGLAVLQAHSQHFDMPSDPSSHEWG